MLRLSSHLTFDGGITRTCPSLNMNPAVRVSSDLFSASLSTVHDCRVVLRTHFHSVTSQPRRLRAHLWPLHHRYVISMAGVQEHGRLQLIGVFATPRHDALCYKWPRLRRNCDGGLACLPRGLLARLAGRSCGVFTLLVSMILFPQIKSKTHSHNRRTEMDRQTRMAGTAGSRHYTTAMLARYTATLQHEIVAT